ncbi:AAA domain-containing protein [Halobaculum sp. WSA2]|uniref:AAA domain-containing protein n=1 Tax=Halobaculum saliterrae TaxID=2073113 RepID=A0A6B0SPS5_9EURY|nr:MoxR family ATPase [Halobaculum saliterrae]MXR40705.1 AAA domain-containing protein [Halobaculum saliterrae]
MSKAEGDPAAVYEALREEAGRVLIGNEEVLERITIAALTGGHVLLEGVPGVAKTTIANLFARATGLEFTRVQMTPDILPADITGSHIYRENVGEFELNKGPVFANVVVADEINRATPKTQSALLEAMQERTVTIEGETLALPDPFTVIATQNPIEMEGVFELPEAQRDRFQFKLTVDLPDRPVERELLDRFDADPGLGPSQTERVIDERDLMAAREAVGEVHVAPPVKEYILDVVRATRESEDIEYGASPRATLAFLNAGKARAAIHGREYVIPDDVKSLAMPILVHRLVLSTEAELGEESTERVVERILDRVAVPADASEPGPDRATGAGDD